jgi:hypothetical protein
VDDTRNDPDGDDALNDVEPDTLDARHPWNDLDADMARELFDTREMGNDGHADLAFSPNVAPGTDVAHSAFDACRPRNDLGIRAAQVTGEPSRRLPGQFSAFEPEARTSWME